MEKARWRPRRHGQEDKRDMKARPQQKTKARLDGDRSAEPKPKPKRPPKALDRSRADTEDARRQIDGKRVKTVRMVLRRRSEMRQEHLEQQPIGLACMDDGGMMRELWPITIIERSDGTQIEITPEGVYAD